MATETITVTCGICRTAQPPIVVPKAAYMAWKGGAYVQDAFPTLSVDERELLISRTCPVCWDDMFAEEEA